MVLIASYNIRKAIAADRRRRPERILEVLGEIGADVVILQEADRRFGERHAAIPLHMMIEQGDYRPVPVSNRHAGMGWHGNAILVRQGRVEADPCVPLVLPTLEPRGAVVADLRADGIAFRVVGMHLDLSGLMRRRQARAILAHLDRQPERRPTILAGDLNEWRPAKGCLDDFAAGHRAVPLGPSFHARRPVGRLDRMFVSEGIAIEACGVHGSLTARSASDHLPVWAELAIG